MSDEQLLPAILEPANRNQLLKLASEAGKNHLSPAQTALKLGLSEKETQILMYNDREVCATYASALRRTDSLFKYG
jgi:hypothetical protein